uniref:Tubulin polyglutamylase TTLL5 n=1 Tax=Lygus hesperus TaxID=30085 RepID=A0A0A9XHG6_LYGHE
MVDDTLKVRLIEVNIMPSLATTTQLDRIIKSRMLAHLLTLVRVVPHRRNELGTGQNTQNKNVTLTGVSTLNANSRYTSSNSNNRTNHNMAMYIPHGSGPTRP